MQARQKKTDDLQKIPSVGVSKEELLKDAGYETFKDLIKACPFEVEDKTGIVRASAIRITSSASEYIDGICPECNSSEIVGSQEYGPNVLDSLDSDVVCDDCFWDGYVEEI